MRLTINLDDDLYAMARSHAIATKTSISKAVGDLLRRRTSDSSPGATKRSGQKSPKVDPKTGFPIIEFENGITMEDIQRAIEDEDVHNIEKLRFPSEK